jgi:hypothetical protein
VGEPRSGEGPRARRPRRQQPQVGARRRRRQPRLFPPTSPAEAADRGREVMLAKAIRRGDATAKRRMIESNVRLVVSIAGYRGFGVPFLDLIRRALGAEPRGRGSSTGAATTSSRRTRPGGSASRCGAVANQARTIASRPVVGRQQARACRAPARGGARPRASKEELARRPACRSARGRARGAARASVSGNQTVSADDEGELGDLPTAGRRPVREGGCFAAGRAAGSRALPRRSSASPCASASGAPGRSGAGTVDLTREQVNSWGRALSRLAAARVQTVAAGLREPRER